MRAYELRDVLNAWMDRTGRGSDEIFVLVDGKPRLVEGVDTIAAGIPVVVLTEIEDHAPPRIDPYEADAESARQRMRQREALAQELEAEADRLESNHANVPSDFLLPGEKWFDRVRFNRREAKRLRGQST